MTTQHSVKEQTGATLEKLLDWGYNFYLEEAFPFPIFVQGFPI